MKFPRATHRSIYIKTQRAGESVTESVREFLEKKVKLKVNPKISKEDKGQRVKLLGVQFLQTQRGSAHPSSWTKPGKVLGQAPPSDQAYPVRQAGRDYPRSEHIHSGMDRILPAGEYAECLRRAGRMDKTRTETAGLETLEERNDPLPRVGHIGSSAAVGTRRGRRNQSLAYGRLSCDQSNSTQRIFS